MVVVVVLVVGGVGGVVVGVVVALLFHEILSQNILERHGVYIAVQIQMTARHFCSFAGAIKNIQTRKF